jgi:hypothetical protein
MAPSFTGAVVVIVVVVAAAFLKTLDVVAAGIIEIVKVPSFTEAVVVVAATAVFLKNYGCCCS